MLRSPRPSQSTPGRIGRSLFVTGTDTGVGKTAFSMGLLALLRRRGLSVTPFKPAETGCNPTPADATALRTAAACDIPLDWICPFSFAMPAAPSVAARLAGSPFTPSDVEAAARKLMQLAGGPLLVEGAGGLLSPYGKGWTAIDLICGWGTPTVLVGRNTLGTINHSLLALAELQRRGADCVGFVLMDTSATNDSASPYNFEEIQSLTQVPGLGVVPYVPVPTAESMADAMERTLDLRPLTAVFTAQS